MVMIHRPTNPKNQHGTSYLLAWVRTLPISHGLNLSMSLGYSSMFGFFQLKQRKVGSLLNLLQTPWFPVAPFPDSQETAEELECFQRDVGDFTKAWARHGKITTHTF